MDGTLRQVLVSVLSGLCGGGLALGLRYWYHASQAKRLLAQSRGFGEAAIRAALAQAKQAQQARNDRTVSFHRGVCAYCGNRDLGQLHLAGVGLGQVECRDRVACELRRDFPLEPDFRVRRAGRPYYPLPKELP
jgi:hypothetical protein